jgi:hypothetical protein
MRTRRSDIWRVKGEWNYSPVVSPSHLLTLERERLGMSRNLLTLIGIYRYPEWRGG